MFYICVNVLTDCSLGSSRVCECSWIMLPHSCDSVIILHFITVKIESLDGVGSPRRVNCSVNYLNTIYLHNIPLMVVTRV